MRARPESETLIVLAVEPTLAAIMPAKSVWSVKPAPPVNPVMLAFASTVFRPAPTVPTWMPPFELVSFTVVRPVMLP